jgi:hypothetical protein
MLVYYLVPGQACCAGCTPALSTYACHQPPHTAARRRWRDLAAKLGGGQGAARELGELLQGIGELLVSSDAAAQVRPRWLLPATCAYALHGRARDCERGTSDMTLPGIVIGCVKMREVRLPIPVHDSGCARCLTLWAHTCVL